MEITNYFNKELHNANTSYFILDTKGNTGDHGDVDFKSYDWSPSKFNRVKEGDLFLYRRPGKASELKGKFYFFGAGKIERIEDIGEDRCRGYIGKPVSFEKRLLPQDLEHYQWHFKQRGSSWGHFFNQYGMNHIVKDDFKGILNLAFENGEEQTHNYDEEIKLIQQQQNNNYYVEDHKSEQKVRFGQKVFADQVKLNYGYRCAITDISTRSFLVGSHIIPWSENKSHRLDPQNGICLSVLVDKAFDKGYIGISNDYKVILASQIKRDKELYDQLKPFEGKKIKYPKSSPPRVDFLEWHLKEIFNK
ncbi:HNH endonuclease [Virgibacillus litoralis]|uniref:Restriction endonuclease n=1 Tax=Virgibacillus litoralis TaxID=578221 RepID=A0ABS4HH63_9BACI|nr:HNH endonuclease [Virgibacillus litoralis]MBP1950059.1 putative restriction endonuclease [Virgibacillus litoralis]